MSAAAEVAAIAASLTQQQREALKPCATNRQCLFRVGLAKWHTRPGHRFPSIRPNALGYLVREYLEKAA
jgi:hypothetical protein